MNAPPATIRNAAPEDAGEIYTMLRELAIFEKLEHQLVGTADQLRDAIADPAGPDALVAQSPDGNLVGYALFFHNFSTFLCRRGLYLEDIYVRPEFRGLGIGKSMLRRLAEIAIERGCGRMEWAVLDWNQNAIDVYRAIGGDVLPDWRIVRLGTDQIAKLSFN